MNMLQYGSGVLPDYKAPARQRTFQCCLSTLGPYDDPVCMLITLYHIETHSALLTTLFLSIQDAPGMNPADPLGCLYLSIQIENVLQYNRSTTIILAVDQGTL